MYVISISLSTNLISYIQICIKETIETNEGNKIESLTLNKIVISILSDKPLKFADQFTFLGSNISSTESDIDFCLAKTLIAIDGLSIIWISDLSDKTKRDFLHVVAVSVLLYECTTSTLMKRMEKKTR